MIVAQDIGVVDPRADEVRCRPSERVEEHQQPVEEKVLPVLAPLKMDEKLANDIMESDGKTKIERKKVALFRKQFVIYLFGMLLIFSAFFTMEDLQTSINVEGGLGALTAALYYGVAIVIGIFITPIALRIFGVKKCMIVSEVCYMMYILANIYPRHYTLLPAAIMVAIAEATIWPCASICNVYFANKSRELSGSKGRSQELDISLYVSYFFVTTELAVVCGNLVTYLVLHAFNKPSEVFENTTLQTQTNLSASFDKYAYCGANDCQEESVVSESKEQYSPTDRTSIYIWIGCLTAMCLSAILLHLCLLPNVRSDATGESDLVLEPLEEKGENEQKDRKESIVASSLMLGSNTGLEKDVRSSYGSLISTTLKQVAAMMWDPKHLLLFPLTLYEGLFYGYRIGDLNRAFASCVIGYSSVGILVVLYGLSHCLSTYIVGRYGSKHGRVALALIATSIDLANYLYCLLWTPSLESSWTVYLSYVCFGISDGIWMPVVNVTFIDYFPGKKDVAAAMWNFWLNIGLTMQYAWSRSFCVDIKIYIQIAFLLLGAVCYVAAELKYSKQIWLWRRQERAEKATNQS